jgi:hypothetical protein
VLLLTQAAAAMSSTNYRLDWFIPLSSGGGGHASSNNYAIDYSIGQTVAQTSASANYDLHMGFWQQFVEHFGVLIKVWLPMTAK